MRTEADKMPESTTSAIGNAPASLMTDLGSKEMVRPKGIRFLFFVNSPALNPKSEDRLGLPSSPMTDSS